MTRAHTNLLKGTLDLLILGALRDQPRHGASVSAWIRESTREACSIEEGTLYPALHRLEARGWIVASWGLSENNRRAKFYRLTSLGRKQLKDERTQWATFSAAVERILGDEPA